MSKQTPPCDSGQERVLAEEIEQLARDEARRYREYMRTQPDLGE